MSVFTNIAVGFKKAWQWLTVSKVEGALHSVAQLALDAAPIVEKIAALVPNKTFQEVVAAYETFGIPLAQQEAADSAQVGNLMLNLGSILLNKLQKSATSTTLLNSAIQIAVLVLKSR